MHRPIPKSGQPRPRATSNAPRAKNTGTPTFAVWSPDPGSTPNSTTKKLSHRIGKNETPKIASFYKAGLQNVAEISKSEAFKALYFQSCGRAFDPSVFRVAEKGGAFASILQTFQELSRLQMELFTLAAAGTDLGLPVPEAARFCSALIADLSAIGSRGLQFSPSYCRQGAKEGYARKILAGVTQNPDFDMVCRQTFRPGDEFDASVVLIITGPDAIESIVRTQAELDELIKKTNMLQAAANRGSSLQSDLFGLHALCNGLKEDLYALGRDNLRQILKKASLAQPARRLVPGQTGAAESGSLAEGYTYCEYQAALSGVDLSPPQGSSASAEQLPYPLEDYISALR